MSCTLLMNRYMFRGRVDLQRDSSETGCSLCCKKVTGSFHYVSYQITRVVLSLCTKKKLRLERL